jgi:hypothetical protein
VGGGFLVLTEDVASVHGTLMLYIDHMDTLRCASCSGSNFQCEASMKRIE